MAALLLNLETEAHGGLNILLLGRGPSLRTWPVMSSAEGPLREVLTGWR